MQYPEVGEHGLAWGEAARPERADWTIDQDRIDDFQETDFVIGEIEELLELARIDFGPRYERVKGQPDYAPGGVLPQDELVTRGAGGYHSAKGSRN